MKAFRRLGAWPLRRIRPPAGASIHYAGTSGTALQMNIYAQSVWPFERLAEYFCRRRVWVHVSTRERINAFADGQFA